MLDSLIASVYLKTTQRLITWFSLTKTDKDQEDFHKISAWSGRWQMSFNVDKCQVLQIGIINKNFDYEMRGVKHCQFSRVVMHCQFSQPCIYAAKKTNTMFSFIKRNLSIKNKNVILLFYNNLVRPHWEFPAQFWFPHHGKDIAILGVKHPATK